jgi:Prenyltransferase and squalene oxidase repeat
VYLESRLDFLRTSQNSDGGWSYFPGKASWFEPTTYATLALHGSGWDAGLDRTWKLLRSWQLPDGSYQPNGEVKRGTWVTAHAVTLASIRGVNDASVKASVDWLLRVVGAEHNVWTRTGSFLHLIKANLDVSHEGWPWLDGNATWIEPTAHTLAALKKVAGGYRAAEVAKRVRDGEDLVLSRRCTDGGWNYGTPNMLYVDLPSFPETTGLALLGLDGRSDREFVGALDFAERFRAETKSSLGKAWLQIALRSHGRDITAPVENAWCSSDVMLAALEALGHPDGNYQLLSSGARATKGQA